MRPTLLSLWFALGASSVVAACSGNDGGAPADAPTPDAGSEAPGVDAAVRHDASAGADASRPEDAGGDAAHHDAGPDGPSCKKELTVVASVGTGAGALAGHTNGCWTVVDADGAANKQFRKCSTSNYQVWNPGAPSYAFDDTNPLDSLSAQQGFLSQCSQGASGDGYEYMAYRGGSWRFLPAPHLRAYFAELYGDSYDDIDSLWSQPGAFQGNASIKAHDAWPMINIGPNPGSGLQGTIESEGLAICKTLPDHGYFGTYVATWNQPMGPSDARVVAFAKALNDCTKK